jgi:hypothetical protein
VNVLAARMSMIPTPLYVIEPFDTVTDDDTDDMLALSDTNTLPPLILALAPCNRRPLNWLTTTLPPLTDMLVVSRTLNNDDPENTKLPACTDIDDPLVMVTLAVPDIATFPPPMLARVLPAKLTVVASLATKLPPVTFKLLLLENERPLFSMNRMSPPDTDSDDDTYDDTDDPRKIALPLVMLTADDDTGIDTLPPTTKSPPWM